MLVRLGGLSLLGFLPLLAVGVVLYGRVGISSQSDGASALAKIAAAGAMFPVMNALFHLGALLLLPGGAALAISLRGPSADPWLLLGGLFLVLAVATGAGLVFALNHGLWGLSGIAAATGEVGAAAGVAADMNLRTQAGAELVQSVGLGIWLLASALAMTTAGWDSWIAWLGIAGGIGFIAAGLSSVLMGVAILGPVLGAVGGLGLLLFATWDVVVGWRLLTL
jgi:hypothetical protein